MKIRYYKRRVYGQENRYAADEDVAAILRDLTGARTIWDDHMDALRKLGHEFEQVLDPNSKD